MDPTDPRELSPGAPAGAVEVFRSAGRRACEERGLVLHTRDLPYRIARDAQGWSLHVPEALAEAALRELRLYEEENRDWPPRETLPPPGYGVAQGAMLYVATLLLARFLAVGGAFGRDWSVAGRADGAALRAGELWRSVTALTLHTGTPHLLSNLVFGAFFGSLVALSHGGGIAWLAALLAGTLGNLANALLLDPAHRSVGASTAVFGAIGVMVGSEWRRRYLLRMTRLKRLAPLLMGLLLLSYLGLEGERTDISAHVTGLFCGLPLGALLTHLPPEWGRSRPHQVAAGALALALLVLAWIPALSRA